MNRSTNGIWFGRSAYWGPGTWTAHEFGRDLGRVYRTENMTWSGHKTTLPVKGSNRPDVTGCASRQEAAEALRDLWNESHGPVASRR